MKSKAEAHFSLSACSAGPHAGTRRPLSGGAMLAARFAGLCMAFAAPCWAATGTEIVEALNAARAMGCAGRPGLAQALEHETKLDEAARRSKGSTANHLEAIKQAGYRPVRAAAMRMRGPVAAQSIARLVARNSCRHLLDPEFTDAGVHQQGGETFIILAAPFSPPPAHAAAQMAMRVLELVNEARAQSRTCGNKPYAAAGRLRYNPLLSRAALAHAEDMAKNSYFEHLGRDGSSPADRLTRTGYSWRVVGENIASGQTTPERAVAGWLRSPTHCANLMNPAHTEMGLAYAVNHESEGGIYWVQLFAAPR